MTTIFQIKRAFAGFLFIALLIASTLFLGTGCNDKPPYQSNIAGQIDTFPGLIVWVKPGISADSLHHWLDSIKAANGAIDTAALCQDCDSRLMLLKGSAPEIYIQHQTAAGGGGTPKGVGLSGEDGPVYYSYNFPIEFGDSIGHFDSIPSPAKLNRVKQFNDSGVTVAVFDTGIDSTLINYNDYFYTSNIPSCLGTAGNNGWNFSATPQNSLWQDDFKARHGTIVSRLIADQVNKFNGDGIKLLPVKIATKEGKGNLFGVLCGLSYAANRGAKIINASFGYYAPDPLAPAFTGNTYAVLFKAYIKEYLTDQNILMVAAAGNAMPGETIRSLDKVSFYPASFARDSSLPNILAVTTVFESGSTASVSPTQNSSAGVVDIGVNADVSAFLFFNPFFGNSRTVDGSSFAAPIVTGQICANYHAMLNAAGVFQANRTNILNALTNLRLLHTNASLAGSIRGQNIMVKRK